MLDDDSGPIILYPVVLEGDGEGDADPGAQDEQRIAPRQRDRIPRKHCSEIQAERHSTCFKAPDIGLDCKNEHGDPKEGEETPEFIGGRRCVVNVKSRRSRSEGDKSPQLLGRP